MLVEKIFLDLKKEGAQEAASRDLHAVEGLDAQSLQPFSPSEKQDEGQS